MTTYGYSRTSRNKGSGHADSAPEVQCRQLVGAGVDSARTNAGVAQSGARDCNNRDHWHRLDLQLARGDVLVVAVIDRLGRRLPRDHVGDR